MKQLIVLLGCILLGVVIFQMMTSNQPGSIKSVSAKVIAESLHAYS